MIANEQLPHESHTMTLANKVSIAVMGTSGSGKTTFINLVSGSDLATSARLESCTQNIQAGADFQLAGRVVKLIDTPSFYDNNRSDVEILTIIADYLASQYHRGRTLHGILYFHRISDVRMSSSSIRSFKLLMNLCGKMSLKNVVIVTSMWDKVTLEEGEPREEQLSTKQMFFKPALDEQAIMLRHNNTIESALSIIQIVLANRPFPLAVQKELVDNKMLLHGTQAGDVLARDLQECAQQCHKDIRHMQDEIADAVQEKDERTKQELEFEVRKLRGDLARIKNEMKNLHARIVGHVDVEWQWKKMHPSEKLATFFRRSQGAPECPDMDSFWSALRDTTTAVSKIRAVFDQSPLPSNLQSKLLENISAPDKDTRTLLKSWMKGHLKEIKTMEEIVEMTLKNKVKHKSH